MEFFFINSPIGLLQVLIKEDKLYSLSKISQSSKQRFQKYKIQSASKFQPGNKDIYPSKIPSKINFKKLINLSYSIDEKTLSVLETNNLTDYRLQLVLKKQAPQKIKKKNSNTLYIQTQKKSALAKKISQQINLYFDARLKRFEIPLYNRGTGFQKKVWRKLQNIPWGQTKQYSQIAKELKKAKAYRAVGNSCGKNPFLIIVPCHRVLSQAGLGGFALGLATKKYLLNLEKGSKSVTKRKSSLNRKRVL